MTKPPESFETSDTPEDLTLAVSSGDPTPQPEPVGPKAGLEKLRLRKTTVAQLDGGGPTQTVETSTKAGLEKEREAGGKDPRPRREGA